MVAGQNISSSEELHSTKAFFLAESGLELAMVNYKNGECDNKSYTFENAPTENITITCESTKDNNSYPPSDIITITSKGQSFDMKRKVEAKFRVYR
jgi:hypothetical protein